MTVEITLLGDVGVRRGLATGADSSMLGSAQAQVALAVLARAGDSGVTREALADVLWAGRLPSTWPSAIRSIVSRVRTFLTSIAPEMDDPVWAHSGRYVLQLPEAWQVDVERAEQAVDDARSALDSGRHGEAHRLAAEAAERLRAPFLPDHDSEWAESVRGHLSDLLLEALETASRAAVAVGDPASALAHAEDAMGRAPLRESAHRCRMAAHAAAGNRGEALLAYQQLRHRLASELGVDPAPETETAYLDLLGSASRPSTPPAPGSAPGSVPFVGREGELATLAGAWRAATRGRRQLVVVTGAPGSGKTRLVVEAARQATAGGGLVLAGWCDHRSADHQPFVEMLDGYLAVPDQRPALPPGLWDELAAVFPSVEGVRRPATAADPLVLAAAITAVVRHITAARPVLALLDDLHWAGDHTLLLLRQLLRHTADERLLVVAVSRDERTCDALVAAGASPGASGAPQTLRLGPLDEAEVRAVVRQLVPDDGGRRPPTTRLLAATAGNPLLLIELLRERGSPTPDVPSPPAARHQDLPTQVRAVVGGMIGPLGRDAADLLRAMSVTTSPFEVDVAGRAAGLDQRTTLDAVEIGLANGLLTEVDVDDAPLRYRFTHDLVRRAVYEDLSAARRQHLHSRWADAVEVRHGSDLTGVADVLAHHRAAAAGPAGDRDAVRWARVAADQAEARGAVADEVRFRQQAWRRVPRGDAELQAELTTELGLSLARAGDGDSGPTLLEGATHARRCGRLDVMARAALGLADLARVRPEVRDDATVLLREVVAAGFPVPGSADHGSGDGPVDGVLGGRAVASLVELEGPASVHSTDLTSASAHLGRRLRHLDGLLHLEERAELARALATVAHVTGDPCWGVAAAHDLAMTAAFDGDVRATDEALRTLAAAGGLPDRGQPATTGAASGGAGGMSTWSPEARARSFDPRRTVAVLLAEHDAAVAVTEGRFVDAERAASTAGAAQDVPGGKLWLMPGMVMARQHLVTRWLRGTRRADQPAAPDLGLRTGGTRDRVGWSRPGAAAGGASETAAPDQVLLALLHRQRGRARLDARDLAHDLAAAPPGDGWLHDVALLALAAAELGDRVLAETVRDMLAPHAERTCGVGYRSFVGTAHFHLGHLAAVTGDWPDAEHHLVAASHQLAAIGARPWLALAQLALASVLAARGRASDLDWITTLREEARLASHQLGLRPPFLPPEVGPWGDERGQER